MLDLERIEDAERRASDRALPSARKMRISAWLGWIAAALLLGVLLSLLIAPALAGRGRGFWTQMADFVTRRDTRFHLESPSVVMKIRELNRLETVTYSIDKIVEGDRESILFPSFLAGDKIILVAHGEVIAGVDLSKLQPGDVSVSGQSVRVRLPKAEILTTRIDNQATRVYSRSTGLLVSADPNLESQVRAVAEQQIGQAAMDEGILSKARQGAKTSVAALLSALGFQSVDVE
jgi:hypothetical protein